MVYSHWAEQVENIVWNLSHYTLTLAGLGPIVSHCLVFDSGPLPFRLHSIGTQVTTKVNNISSSFLDPQ